MMNREAKEVPARALLYYLPRDSEAAQVPLPRSSRTMWKILHMTGCLLPRFKKQPHLHELREPLEEIQMDGHPMWALSPLNKVRKASESRVTEVCNG